MYDIISIIYEYNIYIYIGIRPTYVNYAGRTHYHIISSLLLYFTSRIVYAHIIYPVHTSSRSRHRVRNITYRPSDRSNYKTQQSLLIFYCETLSRMKNNTIISRQKQIGHKKLYQLKPRKGFQTGCYAPCIIYNIILYHHESTTQTIPTEIALVVHRNKDIIIAHGQTVENLSFYRTRE